jgi:hypothetical protein
MCRVGVASVVEDTGLARHPRPERYRTGIIGRHAVRAEVAPDSEAHAASGSIVLLPKW